MVGPGRLRRVLLWALVVFSAGVLRAEVAERIRIAALKSQGTAPYQETLNGFQNAFSKQPIPVDWTVFELDGDASKAVQAVEQVRKSGSFDLVFALGTLATEEAVSNLPRVPIVSGMVLREDALHGAPNATGVILGFTVKTHFEWLRRILPSVSSVGILFNPAENGERVAGIAVAAKRRGIELETVKVEVPQDLPAALERLSRRTEAIWGIPDNVVLNGQTARQILLACFRNRIPFIGVSSFWTKAGALYSLDRDYRDMGDQCAQVALKILQGTPPAQIPVETPRKVLYSLNLRTAGYLNLTVPDPLIRGAAQVFREETDD